MSISAKIDEINQSVTGWINPIWSDDPIPGRKRRVGLAPKDYELVISGHACADSDCLAIFNGYRVVCPVCGHHRDVAQDIVEALDWQQYQREQKAHDEGELPLTRPRPMNEIVDELMGGK